MGEISFPNRDISPRLFNVNLEDRPILLTQVKHIYFFNEWNSSGKKKVNRDEQLYIQGKENSDNNCFTNSRNTEV